MFVLYISLNTGGGMDKLKINAPWNLSWFLKRRKPILILKWYIFSFSSKTRHTRHKTKLHEDASKHAWLGWIVCCGEENKLVYVPANPISDTITYHHDLLLFHLLFPPIPFPSACMHCIYCQLLKVNTNKKSYYENSNNVCVHKYCL